MYAIVLTCKSWEWSVPRVGNLGGWVLGYLLSFLCSGRLFLWTAGKFWSHNVAHVFSLRMYSYECLQVMSWLIVKHHHGILTWLQLECGIISTLCEHYNAFQHFKEGGIHKNKFLFDLLRLHTSLILLNPYLVCKFKKLIYVTTSYKQRMHQKLQLKGDSSIYKSWDKD